MMCDNLTCFFVNFLNVVVTLSNTVHSWVSIWSNTTTGGDSGFGIGMPQRPSTLFLVPSNIILLFFRASILDLSRMMKQPSSQSCPMEIRLELFNLGKTIAF